MTQHRNPFEIELDKNDANYVPLSPLSFLRRTASVYPNRLSVIHGDIRRTWAESYERCVRLASALSKRGVGIGNTVAVMAPNVPELFEAHYGVPMVGGVLNALNIRLDAEAIAFQLQHGEAKVLITDREFSDVINKAVHMIDPKHRPIVIDIDDPLAKGGNLIGQQTYEQFLETGDPDFQWEMPKDEWQSIALNYTSGTTGNPKGVVYHHRGAYLNAVGNIVTWAMPHHPVYLWTLPMFHCNGWCFPWTITAQAGTHVCLRGVTAKGMYDAIADHGVTHMCGAPIVMGLLVNAPENQRRDIPKGIKMMTAGAAPPAAVIEKIERMGFAITHVYGLTEVYGPDVVCAWHEEWDSLPIEERAVYKARQGVTYVVQEGLMVADPATLEPVPHDGKTIGEVFMRGNVVMKGYLKNPVATQEAFARRLVPHRRSRRDARERLYRAEGPVQGHHHLGRREHLDHRGRGRAVPPSGGAGRRRRRPSRRTLGRDAVRLRHAEGWRDGDEAEIIAFCREHLAHFKSPRTVVFTNLPKTSTGKIQKFVLRDMAKQLNEQAAAKG